LNEYESIPSPDVTSMLHRSAGPVAAELLATRLFFHCSLLIL
jgi:hypothetical protein